MNASSPITIDGKIFPYYSLNLAIATKYTNGKEEGSAAMTLTPTRLDENGNGVAESGYQIPVLLGSMADLQEPEKSTVEAIQTALQTYIIAKGL